MKAILVVDVPVLDDGRHLCNECPIWNREKCFCEYDRNVETKGCPLMPINWYLPKDYIYSEINRIRAMKGEDEKRNRDLEISAKTLEALVGTNWDITSGADWREKHESNISA